MSATKERCVRRMSSLLTAMPSETLPAFASRVACSRAVKMKDFLRHIGSSQWGRGTAALSIRLATFTKVDADVLEKHAVRRISRKWQVFGNALPPRDLWRRSPRFCSLCLCEDYDLGNGRPSGRPYFRASWLHPLLEVCTKHSVGLDVLDIDYASYGCHDFSNAIKDNWSVVQALAAKPASREVSASDVYFSRRLNGEVPASKAWLDDFSFGFALRVTEAVGEALLDRQNASRRLRPQSDRAEAIRRGYTVTSKGTCGLRTFLEERDESYRSSAKKGKAFQLYGALYHFLNRNLDSPEAISVIEFVRRHAVSAHPIGPENAFLGFDGQRQLHSIRSASLTYGLHRKTVRKVLSEAGHLPASSSSTLDQRTVLAADIVDSLLSKWLDAVPMEEMKRLLGITANAIRQLLDSGLLSTLEYGPHHASRPVFSRKNVHELINSIERHAMPNAPAEDHVSLVEACAVIGRGYAALVKMILDGDISIWIDEKGEHTTFKNIFVCKDQVRSATRALRTDTATTGLLNLRMVEKLLRTTTKTVRALVDTGLLPSVASVHSFSGAPQRFVEQRALRSFQETFITLHDYRNHLGRGQMQQVKNDIRAKGILPVLDGDAISTVYRRSDLDL
ncbi:TniQ family protein [Sinorhizobium terangae]|uniref:TniQ family protein n=1 Tax=Sinorhizobium terangae TaxID=110322 RepID=UPI0024B1144F|nr:TniQ family protein [Sinorhizobium terangae]WFU49177.1 TniQ family protein [Sinorhizobium terangae]